ncbi:MAG: DUF3734 domain-containing protein [Burkholderiales bacterium]
MFQIDLFNAQGPVPNNIPEVLQRHKDIMYSSRTRFTSDQMARLHRLQHALQDLLEKLPPACAGFRGSTAEGGPPLPRPCTSRT